MASRPRDYDVFKDSLLRYCGYANEVGEAFRAQVHVRWVHLSYGVASTYVFADATDKGWKAVKETRPDTDPKSVSVAFIDTLLWQAFASVIIPGFTINRICWATGHALRRFSALPSPVRKWGTTAVGLGCIPLIIHPIDHFVDFVMDRTVRNWYAHHPRK